jgi:hypothetical protein
MTNNPDWGWHDVLTTLLLQIDRHNLGPALEWAAENRKNLIKLSGREVVAAFHFQLHQAQYLQLFMQKGGFQWTRTLIPRVCSTSDRAYHYDSLAG